MSVSSTHETSTGATTHGPNKSRIRGFLNSTLTITGPYAHGDVLIISACNEQAKQAAAELAERMKQNMLHQLHEHYFTINRVESTQGPQSVTETSGYASTKVVPRQCPQAYSCWGLHRPTLGPRFEVSVGMVDFLPGLQSGAQGFEIPLGTLGQDFSQMSKGVYFTLSINQYSGQIMFNAQKEYQFDEQPLADGETRCLSQPKTYVESQGVRHCIEFPVMTPQQEAQWRNNVYRMLREEGLWVPRFLRNSLPHPFDYRCGRHFFRHKIYTKHPITFSAGIDDETGFQTLVKGVRVDDPQVHHELDTEIAAYQLLQDSNHIPQPSVYNSLGTKAIVEIEDDSTLFDAVFVYDEGEPFPLLNVVDEDETEEAFTDNEKAFITYSLLECLADCHDRDIMLRNIEADSIILTNVSDGGESRYRAFFADFRKTSMRDHRTDTNTLVQETMAPEYQPNRKVTYHWSADMWALAVLLLGVFHEECFKPRRLRARNPRIEADYDLIVEDIEKETGHVVSEVLLMMFSRDPSKRLTLEEAMSWLGDFNPSRQLEKEGFNEDGGNADADVNNFSREADKKNRVESKESSESNDD